VQRRLGDFTARGARVAAIGQGTGAEAARIARRMKLSYPCYGDPSHDAYRELDLGRTSLFGLTLQPFFEDPLGAFRNLREADLAASASPRSDVRRLGGAMVVDPGGRVRFLYRSRTTTDVPRTEAMLAVLDEIASGRR
jgi:hypothetical protein